MADATALHVHRGTRAIQRMVEFAPSSGGLALWVRHHDLPSGTQAPPVATDGHTIFYGECFERLPIAEQAGLVAHEVLHIALRHPQRAREFAQLIGDLDLQLFNICADAIVNSALGHLGWLQLPAASVRLDRLLARALGLDQDEDVALLEWDVERLYRAIDDRRLPSEAGKGSRGSAQGGAAHDPPQGRSSSPADQASNGAAIARREDGPRSGCVRAMGAGGVADLVVDSQAPADPVSEAEATREWSERVLRAHAGDGEHSMLRGLIADLPRVRTPWEQMLRMQLARGLSRRPGLSWSRPTRSYLANQGRAGPDRRLPWEPGVTPARSVPRLVVVVDVSGSIEDALMERFAREIEAITRRLEAGLVLVIGDEAVRQVSCFEPGRSGLRDIEFEGGGGTDFTPLLEEADRHHPDIAVVLTDLEGPARFRPRWPVVWAVPEQHRSAVPPFGRKLVLS